jgi:uncharacterized membrane protein HdeD (DUF308 family)
MRPAVIIGVILIVIGIIALTYQGITYTTHKKIIDIGPIQATAETKKTLPLPPIVGVLAFAGGIVLVIAGTRRS